jgi:hypothetical protein
MYYIKSQFEETYESSLIYGWGKASRYIPIRHVDHFKNGNVLHYHEDHYFDDYQMLADPQFDGVIFTSS